MESIIELKKIMKIYNMGDVEVKALNGINLTIKKGEFLGSHGSIRFRKIHTHEHTRMS